MIYKFTLISDEVDQFRREIQIDPDHNFLDLHKAIFKSMGYEPIETASFFICDDDWEHKTEISMFETDDNPEEDSWLMDETPLSEFIEDEGQRLTHRFDSKDERYFFIELTEIILGKDIPAAKCTLKAGNPPAQFIIEEEVIAPKVNTTNTEEEVDESFYGDQEFDDLEIEGFENIDKL